jgi:hypothetical protein
VYNVFVKELPAPGSAAAAADKRSLFDREGIDKDIQVGCRAGGLHLDLLGSNLFVPAPFRSDAAAQARGARIVIGGERGRHGAKDANETVWASPKPARRSVWFVGTRTGQAPRSCKLSRPAPPPRLIRPPHHGAPAAAETPVAPQVTFDKKRGITSGTWGQDGKSMAYIQVRGNVFEGCLWRRLLGAIDARPCPAWSSARDALS